MSKTKVNVKDMTFCALFTVLIAVGAFIKIPVPVCPFTLQFFFTTMAGIILGGKRGAISVIIYTVLGLVGLPIFAEGGGIWYVLKPTFGYMIGFIVGSYITGTLVEKKGWGDVKHIFVASFLGLLAVYAIGMLYYYVLGNYFVNSPIGLWPLFVYCFLLAVPGDFALCILAAVSTKQIKKSISSYL